MVNTFFGTFLNVWSFEDFEEKYEVVLIWGQTLESLKTEYICLYMILTCLISSNWYISPANA